MIIKSLVLDITLNEVHSLKDKRNVIKSIMKRLHQKFNVSISEIDEWDAIKQSVIGIVVITNTDRFADEVLDKCLNLIESEYNVEIVNIERERC